MPKIHAIVVAAGKSQRFGKADKLLADLAGKPVIWHTVKAFEDNPKINEIILVAGKQNLLKFKKILQDFSKISKIIEGGKTRQESSFLGLKVLEAKPQDIVLIHNGANPLVSQADIYATIQATEKYQSAVLGKALTGTLKKVSAKNFIQKTIDRNQLWMTETPQGIKYGLAINAFLKAEKENFQATDDVQIVENFGQSVKILPSSTHNIKITDQADLELAKMMLEPKTWQVFETCQVLANVGIGQDSHRFSEKKKPLVLGNYEISKTGGLEGNSDADVIIHALCNALSSAIGGNSLSNWSDKMCQKGITNSKFYLEKIYQEVLKKGFVVNNLSISLEAGKPKLEKRLPAIQKSLAKLLKVKNEQIGITVTSGEGLTDFGKGKGIQCFCYLSLGKQL